MLKTVIPAHFENLSSLIFAVSSDRNAGKRAHANLDALMLSSDASLTLATDTFKAAASADELAAAVVLAFSLKASSLQAAAVEQLECENEELRTAARVGLRLTDIGSVAGQLETILSTGNPPSRAAAFDVLMFHRKAVRVPSSPLLTHEDAEVRELAVAALGRSPAPSVAQQIATYVSDANPRVRREALRAIARLGDPSITSICRRQLLSDRPCHETIRFLGVVGAPADFKLLRELIRSQDHALPAVNAMGAMGASDLIPDLLRELANPLTANAAVQAMERITGRSIPRGDPPPPPEHLTEDEIDFWNEPGPPLIEPVQQWWRENQYSFESGKRYQAGICVSDDPLGAHFDDLPDHVRRDVYLRQRALLYDQTPDWELETWPQYQRNPAWSQQLSS